MSYRDDMRQRMAEAVELHQPDNAGPLCTGCLAEENLEDWPCDEVRYAVMVEGILERQPRRDRAA